MKNFLSILINLIPIFIMISLIPFVTNDWLLTIIYMAIIIFSFFIKNEKNDLLIFILGFLFMTISEYFFVNTGVEFFKRNSFLGIMPLWLPFLWGYGFVVIKRFIEIINKKY